jgi:thiol-disulfide isomerase/thioredoxin
MRCFHRPAWRRAHRRCRDAQRRSPTSSRSRRSTQRQRTPRSRRPELPWTATEALDDRDTPWCQERSRSTDQQASRLPCRAQRVESWCGPCRDEFKVFAAESGRYGRRVAFLGVDTSDSATEARSFLVHHPVSCPSYQSSSTQLAPLAVLEGLPTTIYISETGKVIGMHIGQDARAAAL